MASVASVRRRLESGLTKLLADAEAEMAGVSMSLDQTTPREWRATREAMFDLVADLLGPSEAAEAMEYLSGVEAERLHAAAE